MAQKKISELPEINLLTDDDIFPVVDLGTSTTYRANISVIANAISKTSFVSSGFFDSPDLFEEVDTYFYYGWTSINGDWLVRRRYRSNAVGEDASSSSNPSYSDLSNAWVDRVTLTYGG